MVFYLLPEFLNWGSLNCLTYVFCYEFWLDNLESFNTSTAIHTIACIICMQYVVWDLRGVRLQPVVSSLQNKSHFMDFLPFFSFYFILFCFFLFFSFFVTGSYCVFLTGLKLWVPLPLKCWLAFLIFFFLTFKNLYVWIFSLHVSVHHSMSGACGDQRRLQIPWIWSYR